MIVARERADARRQSARQAEISRRAESAAEARRLAYEREAAEQALADARTRLASRLVKSAAPVGGGVVSMLMQPVVDDSLSRAQQRPSRGR